MPERPEFETITAPLAYWANRRGRALAVAEGERAFSFAALHDAVRRRADALAAENGPAILWVGDAGSELDRLVEFCAIVETGRAAAIADPDWPATLRTTIEAALPRQPTAPAPPRPSDLFYVGFTSGSTGLPKGFTRDPASAGSGSARRRGSARRPAPAGRGNAWRKTGPADVCPPPSRVPAAPRTGRASGRGGRAPARLPPRLARTCRG